MIALGVAVVVIGFTCAVALALAQVAAIADRRTGEQMREAQARAVFDFSYTDRHGQRWLCDVKTGSPFGASKSNNHRALAREASCNKR